MDIKLVIFDCDGTLIDSEYINNKATSDVLISLGHKKFTIEHCVSHFAGCSMHDILDTLQRLKISNPMKTLKIMHESALEMAKADLKRIKNSFEMLERIDLPKAIASNGERLMVIESLKVTGLMPYFREDCVFTRELVKKAKPAPDLYLYVAQKMGNIDPKNCLVVEDSVRGITAGRKAGMNVLAFTGGNHHHAESRNNIYKANPIAIITNLIQVLDYI